MENPTAPPRGTHRKWGLRVGCKEHGRQRPRSLVSRPQQSSLYWALKCILQITRSAILVPIVLAQLLEPPCTDPYARWCGRGGAARLPLSRSNLENEIASFRGSRLKSCNRKTAFAKKIKSPIKDLRVLHGRLLSSLDRFHKLRRNKSRLGSIANANARKSAAVWPCCPSAISATAPMFIRHAQGKAENLFCLGVNLTVSNSPLAGGEIWLFPS